MMLRFVFIFALVLRFDVSEGVSRCPFGLSRTNNYVKVFGDYCYRFQVNVAGNRKDYGKAAADCSTLGGTLAVIKSKEVDKFLEKQLIRNFHVQGPVWIGLDDRKKEETFVWADGSVLGKDANYTNFAHGEGPDSSWYEGWFHDCVALDPTVGKWRDYRCKTRLWKSQDRDYICQYKKVE